MTSGAVEYSPDDIAIIGMAGRFPGAKNLEEFWQNLCDGVESIAHFSDEELLEAGIQPEQLRDPNYVKAKGALDEIETFDAAFFGFHPREAQITDPQHRLFLECASDALEHAGYNPDEYQGRIGVFAGAALNTYLLFNLYSNPEILRAMGSFQTLISSDKDFLATRTSYKLNLRGPSMTVQTACSTSLVAVCQACQSLLSYQSDIVLAGGVSITVPKKSGYQYQEGEILSPDGHCRAFDTEAGGTVSGNGIGLVVLKRLADAQADGDQIYAVIKSFALNNDGSGKVGYTAPSINGQAEVIAETLAVAEINPETISYIEAHGTGTRLGDPIEVAALTKAFAAKTDRTGFCALGSVKTNIGHLDTAAGIAGLIKTVLALKHQQIPPSLNFNTANPALNLERSPFYVNNELRDWVRGATPRRAGVSSFGIGGTNAHIIMEEPPVVAPEEPGRDWELLTLSAKTRSALDSATHNLAVYLKQYPALSLADVAYTLQVGRQNFNHRRTLVVRHVPDAIQVLEALPPDRVQTAVQEQRERAVTFMFPGQGAQYVNMGRELYEQEQPFRAAVDECAALLRPHLGLDVREVLYPPAGQEAAATEQLMQTQITQPALFVVEYALAQLWQSWGIQPAGLIGHSVGEYVAACLAGVFSLEAALKLIAARGKLIQSLPGGAMLSVELASAELEPLIGPQLSVAAINGARLTVVSGTSEAIETLEQTLSARGVECRRLHTSHAFHSAMLDPIIEPFTLHVVRARPKPPAIPFISNVTGTWISDAEATDPHYWARQVRAPVNFAAGLETLVKEPDQVLLEVGPGHTLSTFVRQHPARRQQPSLQSLRHPQEPQPDQALLLATLGKLWLAGVRIDWPAFYAGQQRRRVALPTYPFERQRYWIEPRRTAAPAEAEHSIDLTQPVEAMPVVDGTTSADALAASEPLRMAISERAAEPVRVMAEPLAREREHSALHAVSNGNGTNGTSRPPMIQPGAATMSASLATANGHTDRPAAAPRTEIEAALATIWKETLGLEQIDIHEDFFELGGHSLVASRLISRVRSHFGVELALYSLFQSPTIAGLAERIAQAQSTPHATSSTAITKLRHDGPIPAALALEWQWRYDPEGVKHWRYTNPRTLRLRGLLNVAVLEQALNEVVRRHEMLRTTFQVVDGRLVQHIQPSIKLALPLVDLRQIPQRKRMAEAIRMAEEQVRWWWDLEQGPLLRASLLRLEKNDHILILATLYVAIDAQSVDIIHREMNILYEAFLAEQPSPLPEPELQFADFVIWQRQWLQGEVLEQQLNYWRRQLADASLVLPLPSRRLRAPAPTYIGERQYPVIVKTLLSDLRALSRQEGVTLFMTLLAAFITLLQRFTERDDIIVGTPVVHRPAEAAGMVGRFTNHLALRTDLSGNPTFREVLQRVRQTMHEAYANSDVPFDMVAEEFRKQGDPRHRPIYQVYLSVSQSMIETEVTGTTTLTQTSINVERGKADWDITLVLNEIEDRMGGVLQYNTDLFEAKPMMHFMAQFEAVLESAVANPDQRIAEIPLAADAIPGNPRWFQRIANRRPAGATYHLGANRVQERRERWINDRTWRIFLLIWFGQLVSIIGSGLTGFALGVWSFERSGGAATALTLIYFFGYIPVVLLSPVAGALVDRWSRKWGMILSDAGSAATTLILVLLMTTNQLEFWHIYTLTGISAIFRAFQFPAYAAATTQLVPKERLGQANGLVQLAAGVGQLVAPLLAGFLAGAIGINGVISIDLLTFLFAVSTLLWISIPRPQQSAEGAVAQGTLSQETNFGWRYIRTRPGLFGLLLFFAASNFLMGTITVLSTPLVLSFASPAALGTVLSVAGLGILAGSVVMSIWGGPQRKVYGVLGGMLLSSVSMILAGLLPSAWLLGVAAFFFTFGLPIIAASSQVIWQRKVPADIQGRVFGIRAAIATGAMPLAFGISGPLADYVFQPLMNGPLASTIGRIIGVGSGRGIGLMFIVLGMLGVLSVIVGYRHDHLRLVEDELPDAPPLPAAPPAEQIAPGTPPAHAESSVASGAVANTQQVGSVVMVPRGAQAQPDHGHPPLTSPAARPRRRAWRIFRRVLVGLVTLVLILALLAAAGGTWLVRRSWPQVDGTLKLAGLSAPVQVVRDTWGVPHIYAQNEPDLFQAQGYVHAQDRLWQMEFNRRVGSGTLSAIIGRSMVQTDLTLRTMGMRRAAQQDWLALDAETRTILEDYTKGVNAYIETHRDRLPIEFTLMQTTPAPWTPVDSLTWGKMMSFNLGGNYTLEMLRAQIISEEGEAAAQALMPESSADSSLIVPAEAQGYHWLSEASLPGQAAVDALRGESKLEWGSNNWVVSGSRTATGKPLLANDTHLGLNLPNVWYENGLHGGRFNTVGFSFPGVPMVVIGHNDRIAWGVTNLGADVQDLYLEKVNDRANPTQYEFAGKWQDLQVIDETIEVQNGAPVPFKVLLTRHGPILNAALGAPPDAEPMALRWTANEGADIFSAIRNLNLATNWEQFRTAVSTWDAPGQNFVYADTDGNIGYQATGRIPIRAQNHTGMVPIPGWTGQNEWQGYVPFAELPSMFNPEQGFVASANNKIVDDEYAYHLASEWAPDFRAQRITELLSADRQVTVEKMAEIQKDTYSIPGVAMKAYLLAAKPENDLQARALAQVQAWDGRMEPDRAGAAIYQVWYKNMLNNTFGDDLSPRLMTNYLSYAGGHIPFMITLLGQTDNPWFDNASTPERENATQIVQKSFAEAVTWLSERYGADPQSWSWGQVHTVRLRHQPLGLSGIMPLEWGVNSERLPAHGDNSTVNAGSLNYNSPFEMIHGSSQRMILDMSNFNNSKAMHTIGQSGQPFHPHYNDLFRTWQNVEYHPMFFTRESLATHSGATLTLQP